MVSSLWDIYMKINALKPLVHCITNPVTVNDCANALLAVGARPIMASHPDETAEVQGGASSLVLNMGAIANFGAMESAAETAVSLGHPVVVDPVGVSASTLRRRACLGLFRSRRVTCVRGNASEIAALLSDSRTASGLEAECSSDAVSNARALAREYSCCVVSSGADDIVTDGASVFRVSNGDPMMARVTGTGCMSSALLGAFYAAEDSLLAAVASCAVMGMAGELAAEETRGHMRGTGTFRTLLMDGLSLVDESVFARRLKVVSE